MSTFNSPTRWGWPAIALHWIGAVLIVLLLGHGWWMTHFAARPERAAHYAGHAALGYDFLALLVLRLLWRWMNPVPALPGDLKPWERYAANIGHLGLYLLMFAASLSGCCLAGTGRRPYQQDVFGLTVPLITTNRAMHDVWENRAHGVFLFAGGAGARAPRRRVAPSFHQGQYGACAHDRPEGRRLTGWTFAKNFSCPPAPK
jgi:cytochrome b561